MNVRSNNVLVAVGVFLFASTAIADCGVLPVQPALLDQPQLEVSQVVELGPQMEAYFEKVDVYKVCIDQIVTSLDPDSEGYQQSFEDHLRLLEQVEDQKLMTIGRYNNHIETAVETPQDDSQ